MAPLARVLLEALMGERSAQGGAFRPSVQRGVSSVDQYVETYQIIENATRGSTDSFIYILDSKMTIYIGDLGRRFSLFHLE